MPHLIFKTQSSDISIERSRYDRTLLEFMRGASTYEALSGFSIRIEEGLKDPVRVLTLQLRRIEGEFRRVADDLGDFDVDVIWLVRRGVLTINQDGRIGNAADGQIVCSHSRSPVTMQQYVDCRGRFEAQVVIVPSAFLRTVVTNGFKPANPLSIGSSHSQCAERSFQSLFEFGDVLPASASHQIALIALRLLEDELGNTAQGIDSDVGRSQQRWRDVVRCVNERYCDPHLSVREVADRCHMSLRYVAALSSRHGTTLSDLLWNIRLARAKECLQASRSLALSITEVATRAGFKSVAHFSRRFKHTYGISPAEFRRGRAAQLELSERRLVPFEV